MASSAVATIPVDLTLPHYQPAERPELAKKRLLARRALEKVAIPSDKKYTNWKRLGVNNRFAGLPIGGRPPQFSVQGEKVIALSLKDAIKAKPEIIKTRLQKVLKPKHHYFAGLSGAYYTNGAMVIIPKGIKANVVAEFDADLGKLNAYRSIIIVEQGAEATYTQIERSRRGKETIVCHGFEAYVEADAKLNVFGLQQWPAGVTNLASYRGSVKRSGRLNWLLGSFGSDFSQIDVESELAEEGAETEVKAVYYGSGKQHFDQQLTAYHLSHHTTSDTYARGIVDDQSKAVYRGMIRIDQGAHGSAADQNGHAMLMANTAHADAIPGLEIDANDVTAGHGATVGQIDEEQLFYLMSRGLSPESATNLVIRGFFEDLFKRITNDDIRKQFWTAVENKLRS